MNLVITKAAAKDLMRIDARIRARIEAKIDQLASDPTSLAANVKAIKGSGLYRLRVADYRVIYRLNAETEAVAVMIVLHVKHRRDAYD